MFDIKKMRKFCPKEFRNEITDFASLKKVMLHEIRSLKNKGTLKDAAPEIKAKMEWLRARNRLSEISLSLTIVSVVLSVITALLSLMTNKCGAGDLIVCICVMIGLTVISGIFSIGVFFTHKSECYMLAYCTIKLELIEEEIKKENERMHEKEKAKQLETQNKNVKRKRGGCCFRYKK